MRIFSARSNGLLSHFVSSIQVTFKRGAIRNFKCKLIEVFGRNYRPLIQFVSDLCPDDTVLLQVAWRIANDTLRTDACLMYAPSLIALACLHIACVIQKKDAKQWFSELNVDMEKIFEITRHIIYLYEIWNTYDEKDQIKEILSRMPKVNIFFLIVFTNYLYKRSL